MPKLAVHAMVVVPHPGVMVSPETLLELGVTASVPVKVNVTAAMAN
jgi:hypothetical protein